MCWEREAKSLPGGPSRRSIEVATALFVLVVIVDLAQGLGIADRERQ
jgi:hypothetical protein